MNLPQRLVKKVFERASTQGLSQADLSKKTGISESGISEIKSGKKMPRLDNFLKLAEAVSMRLGGDYESTN